MELDTSNDFGFTTVEHVSPDAVVETNEKLQKVKKMIVPLLDNLMKDPQKDIHWPGRDKVLRKFKNDLLDVIDGTAKVEPK